MKQPRLTLIDYTNEINAPVAEVFAAYTRMEEWPRWLRGVEACGRKWSEWKPGNPFWFRITGFPFSMPLKVFVFEDCRRIAWGLGWPGSSSGAVVRNFDFTELPGGRTRVRHREWAEGVRITYTWFFRPFVARFSRDWAADLKDYCEGRPVSKMT